MRPRGAGWLCEAGVLSAVTRQRGRWQGVTRQQRRGACASCDVPTGGEAGSQQGGSGWICARVCAADGEAEARGEARQRQRPFRAQSLGAPKARGKPSGCEATRSDRRDVRPRRGQSHPQPSPRAAARGAVGCIAGRLSFAPSGCEGRSRGWICARQGSRVDLCAEGWMKPQAERLRGWGCARQGCIAGWMSGSWLGRSWLGRSWFGRSWLGRRI